MLTNLSEARQAIHCLSVVPQLLAYFFCTCFWKYSVLAIFMKKKQKTERYEYTNQYMVSHHNFTLWIETNECRQPLSSAFFSHTL